MTDPAYSDDKGRQPAAEEDILLRYTSGVLQELFDAIDRRLEQGFAAFEQEVDAFYASPQSRDAKAIDDFWVEHKNITVDNIAVEAGMAYLRQSRKVFLEEILTSPRPVSQAHHFFSWYYLENYLSHSGLSEEQKDSFKATANGLYDSIIRWKKRWDKVQETAISKNWKPVHIISGHYGVYNTCLCYDEEFQVLFSLSPDDNYYHWNDYILSPCCVGKEDAERYTGKTLPGGTEQPPCFQTYFDEDVLEIHARMKPLEQE